MKPRKSPHYTYPYPPINPPFHFHADAVNEIMIVLNYYYYALLCAHRLLYSKAYHNLSIQIRYNNNFTFSLFSSCPQKTYATAVYDNIADSPEELAFRRGDILEVLERDTNGMVGWWLCMLRGRKVSQVYIALLHTIPVLKPAYM